MTEDTAPIIRPIIQTVTGMAASDGAGVRLKRVLGQPALDMLDPFLMLDEFKSDRAEDYIAGFPDHPHRGFETVTYMLAGRMRHADNKGHEGVIEAGGVQWMTAGSGIVHSEMPEQDDGLMWGFQLWINLPAAEKMKPPAYQEFDAEAIPEEARDGGCLVRVVAGETAAGTRGPVSGISTTPLHLDITLPPPGGGRASRSRSRRQTTPSSTFTTAPPRQPMRMARRSPSRREIWGCSAPAIPRASPPARRAPRRCCWRHARSPSRWRATARS